MRGALLSVLSLCLILGFDLAISSARLETLEAVFVRITSISFFGSFLFSYVLIVVLSGFWLVERRLVWCCMALIGCAAFALIVEVRSPNPRWGNAVYTAAPVLFLLICVLVMFGLERLRLRRIDKVIERIGYRWIEIFFVTYFVISIPQLLSFVLWPEAPSADEIDAQVPNSWYVLAVVAILLPAVSVFVFANWGRRVLVFFQALIFAPIWLLLPYFLLREFDADFIERTVFRLIEVALLAIVLVLMDRIYRRALKHRSRAFDIAELGKVF